MAQDWLPGERDLPLRAQEGQRERADARLEDARPDGRVPLYDLPGLLVAFRLKDDNARGRELEMVAGEGREF